MLCFTVAVVLLQPLVVQGGVTAAKPTEDQAIKPVPQEEDFKVVQLTIIPAPEPDPALKYRFLPSADKQKPGNAILKFYRAQYYLPEEKNKHKDQIDKYLDMPLSELPENKIQKLVNEYSKVLKEIEAGSMLEDAEFELPLEGGISMMLTPLADFRDMAKILNLRARLEIARGRYEEAIQTLQAGFAFGEDIGEGGMTLINALVGIAIDELLLERVRELIDQGGPNMYWALADLPNPLINMRKAFDWEMQVAMNTFPQLQRAMEGTMTVEEANELLQNMSIFSAYSGDSGDLQSRFAPPIFAALNYAKAKKTLIQQGRSRKEVEAMPVSQVVAVYCFREYQHWRDEIFKWLILPYAQAKSSDHEFGEIYNGYGRFNPFLPLLPGLSRIHFILVRVDRNRAILQTVEAIRCYVADHGRLPENLERLYLPAPIDPITGKAFQYNVGENSFTLTGPAPKGERDEKGIRYEVTLKPTPPKPTASTRPAASQPSRKLSAEGPWRGIEPFLQDETFAVIRFALAELNSDAGWKQITNFIQEANPNRSMTPKMRDKIRKMRDKIREFVQAGGTELFVVLNLDPGLDIIVYVVPLGPRADADTLSSILTDMESMPVRQLNGALLMAKESLLQALREAPPAERPRLVNALKTSQGSVRVAMALSDNLQRVVEEVLAVLPQEPFEIRGATLTRGLQQASLALSLQPDISLQLMIQSQDAAAAQALAKLVDQAIAFAGDISRWATETIGEDGLDKLTTLLRPQVKEDRFILQLDCKQLIALMHSVFIPMGQKQREMSLRQASRRNISKILSACYKWARKHQNEFPPDLQTLVDDDMLEPKMLINPLRPELGQKGYVYLRLDASIDKVGPMRIVIYEAHEKDCEGVSAGFADSHVEWMPYEEFRERMKKQKEQDKSAEVKKADN